MTTQTRIERITETTVGSLSGEDVAAANGCVAEYRLPDGTQETGPSMLLCVLSGEDDVRVGVGSQLSVRGQTWTVTTVQLGDAGTGHIELTTESARDRSPAEREELDFFFTGSCCLCSGTTGWDGTTNLESGRVEVGMRCIRCPSTEWETGGRIERIFFEGPPVFTPGRPE